MKREHITVCICTYKRPELLKKLLNNLSIQETENSFSVSVSIVDNDIEFSSKQVIDDFKKNSILDVTYIQVPERNLALLRNRSIEDSKGDYVAFIDDDEYPIKNWLFLLHRTIHHYNVAGVLGPVLPKYQIKPPNWVEKGKFCERTRLKTGTYLNWRQTRTGNVLLKREIFLDPDNMFDLRFSLGGEDDTLFERLINNGFKFIWCDEAIVYEDVPPSRLTVGYFLKRSRLIGFMSYAYFKDTRSRFRNLLVFLKSSFAFVFYIVLLPIYLIRGYHHFVKLLIRLNNHRAVVLTFLRILKIENRDI